MTRPRKQPAQPASAEPEGATLAEVFGAGPGELPAVLDTPEPAPPPPPPAPARFRVLRPSRFVVAGMVHQLAEGSIVSASTHDMTALRAQQIPMEEVPWP